MNMINTLNAKTPNILTFDIEGFIESSRDSMCVKDKYISEKLEAEEIEINTIEILDVLAEFKQKATFFILARIARDMPLLVKKIAGAGHEIACHSFYHRRLFDFTQSETKIFLREAKSLLEDVSGNRVYGFRAPDFSIRSSNIYVLDLLRELSFTYDSSIVPTGLHDVYGINNFSTTPAILPNGLIEIPLTTVKIFNQNIPFGGGGYLRIYPFWVTKTFFWAKNRKNTPCTVYLHPYEMGKVIRKIDGIDMLRRFRTYAGITSVKEKLRFLLRHFRFVKAIDYIKENRIPEA